MLLHKWLAWQATQTGDAPVDTGISLSDSESPRDFLQTIGLDDLCTTLLKNNDEADTKNRKNTLSRQAAEDLGLMPGIPVGQPLVDASAGATGMICAHWNKDENIDFNRRVALIAGTSNCYLAVSSQPRKITGIWGPTLSGLIPDMWLNEAGQSAAGSLIEHVIQTHPAFQKVEQEAKSCSQTIYQYLDQMLVKMAKSFDQVPYLTKHIHILPYFLGNRNPRADPDLTGIVTGLTLTVSRESLALHYLATLQAIAMGGAHIINTMNQGGYAIDTIIACGGSSHNRLFLQTLADCTRCQIHLPKVQESVLLGSAIAGAIAAGDFNGDRKEAMQALNSLKATINPVTDTGNYFSAKYSVFLEMYEDQEKYVSGEA